MPDPPRLLVAVRDSPTLSASLAELLPAVPALLSSPADSGPWPSVEALLIGTPARDLPRWSAEATPRLRFVQRVFTGLDGFPFDRFPPTVAVAGNGGGYAPYVAEHAVALALALAHRLPEGGRQIAEGRLRPPVPNRYLVGRMALILGFGEIGRATASRLSGLGMRIEALTRTGAPMAGAGRTYAAGELRSAVAGAELVVDCRPLTRVTRGSIDRAVLAAMRPDATLVNVSRAATVVEEDLRGHLATHPSFRAGFDVWWHEEFATGAVPEGPGFAAFPNFLGTPHSAGIGAEAQRFAERTALENLARFFRGETPRFLADRTEYLEPPE